jgi:hypothetical protein
VIVKGFVKGLERATSRLGNSMGQLATLNARKNAGKLTTMVPQQP